MTQQTSSFAAFGRDRIEALIEANCTNAHLLQMLLDEIDRLEQEVTDCVAELGLL